MKKNTLFKHFEHAVGSYEHDGFVVNDIRSDAECVIAELTHKNGNCIVLTADFCRHDMRTLVRGKLRKIDFLQSDGSIVTESFRR